VLTELIELLFDPATLAASGAAAAVFVAVMGVLPAWLERDQARRRMRRVAERRRELRLSRLERQNRPLLRRQEAAGLLRSWVERLKLRDALLDDSQRLKLLQAGWRRPNAATLFVAARLVAPLACGGLAALLIYGDVYKVSPALKPAFTFAGLLAGFYLPGLLLTNAVQRRRQAFALAFPDALDLLLICVESGLSMEAALSRVAQETADAAPVLAEEIELTTAELAYLPDRRQALENFARRVGLPSVRAVCGTLIQAEKYGTPLTAALRTAAQENREARMAAAERKAGALPAKLTVPMVLFFLPVLFIVILGPAIIQLTGSR
jgi:tight adherence protein C